MSGANADSDVLNDAEEMTFGTDPYLTDTDGDFILDSDELLLTGTNPLLADSDLNGFSDYEEWVALVPRRWDLNKNGLLDVRVTQHLDDLSPFTDVWWANAHLTDYDGDGISDREEILYGNPERYFYMRAYVDLPNGEGEIYDSDLWAGTDHWDATDYDHDGLNATEEAAWQTDPYDPDTDGMGCGMGWISSLPIPCWWIRMPITSVTTMS